MLIAQIIAQWAEVEVQAAILLAAMINADVDQVTALYLSLSNARAKREAMDAVADFVFPDEQRNLYDAIMRAKIAIEKERSTLAHGIFGIAIEDNEGIIIVSTADMVKHKLDMRKTIIKTDITSDSFLGNLRSFNRNVHHYSLYCLECILADMAALHPVLCNFIAYVRTLDHDDEKAGILHQQLLSSPLVQRFLSPTNGNRKIDP